MIGYGLSAAEKAHERLDAALQFETERAAIRLEIESMPPEPQRRSTEFVSGETDFEFWASVAADNVELWGMV